MSVIAAMWSQSIPCANPNPSAVTTRPNPTPAVPAVASAWIIGRPSRNSLQIGVYAIDDCRAKRVGPRPDRRVRDTLSAMRNRRVLRAVPLGSTALAGLLAGHWLAYDVAVPGSRARGAVLSATGHG